MGAPERKRRQKIEAWLLSLPAEEILLISSVSVAEIGRGIALLSSRDSEAAHAIKHAFDRVVSAFSDAVITPSHDEWQTFASLSAIPELRSLLYGKNKKNQPRSGADIHLAVQANTLAAAIATSNVQDFALINRFFPIIGGILSPTAGEWIVNPAASGVVCESCGRAQCVCGDGASGGPSRSSGLVR